MRKSNTAENQKLAKYITAVEGKPCFYCVLCGEFYYGYGNNPYPLAVGENDECCNDCNDTKVIPARLAQC